MSNPVDLMMNRRISAIIRTKDQGIAEKAMQAAVDGGFRLVEFTLTTPGALDLIERFSKNGDLLVGAGTVLTPEQAEEAVRAGARFIVSPVTDPKVVHRARELGAATIPGAFTPLEIQRAGNAGADFVKIFPEPHHIPTWIKQTLGPFPNLRLFPTAGITEENFVEALQAGAVGVGFVAGLFSPADLARGDFQAIQDRAVRIHARLEAMPA